MLKQIEFDEALTQLDELFNLVENGETVVFTRQAKAFMRLEPIAQARQKEIVPSFAKEELSEFNKLDWDALKLEARSLFRGLDDN